MQALPQEAFQPILQFWFRQDSSRFDYEFDNALWFRAGPKTDEEIKEKFEDLLVQASKGELQRWPDTPEGALSLVLLLSQFPRHIYRGDERMFTHDKQAASVARGLVESGAHLRLTHPQRLFVYLALAMAESVDDARLSVDNMALLCETCPAPQCTQTNRLRRIVAHMFEVLLACQRFPHRNAFFNPPRVTTDEEKKLMQQHYGHLGRSLHKHAQRKALAQQDRRQKQQKGQEQEKKSSDKPMLKILMLHGKTQNSHFFRVNTSKLRQALQDKATLVYADAPFVMGGAYNEASASDNAPPSMETKSLSHLPTHHLARQWFAPTDDNSVYHGLSASLAYLNFLFRTEGPFDGVIGFSQGGAMANLLAAMQPSGDIKLQFAVNISGFKPRANECKVYFPDSGASYPTPTLHVYGEADQIVTPKRTKEAASYFQNPQFASHGSGHNSPAVWPFQAVRDFVLQFQPVLQAPNPKLGLKDQFELSEAGEVDESVKALLRVARSDNASPAEAVWELIQNQALSDQSEVSPVLSDLSKMAVRGLWADLNQLYLRLTSADASPYFVALSKEIVTLYSKQLSSDLACLRRMGVVGPWEPKRKAQEESKEERKETEESKAVPSVIATEWPSTCAIYAPRRRSHFSSLSRQLALSLFPSEQHVVAAPKPDAPAPTQPEVVSQIRYEKLLSGLRAVLNRSSPLAQRKAEAQRKAVIPARVERDAALYTLQAKERLQGLEVEGDQLEEKDEIQEIFRKHFANPIHDLVVNPKPMPVDVSASEEFDALLGFLKTKQAVADSTMFNRGTLTSSGTIDLCKEVLGPRNIHSLMDALDGNSAFNALLIGNNVVENEGARAIADFVKSKQSHLNVLYLAGNHFDHEGARVLCDALEHNSIVRALWLKRNPLGPKGMDHFAHLIKNNNKIEVFDLVNCGLLDDGVIKLFDALESVDAQSSALRHLYIGLNGITLRGVERIASYLGSGRNQLVSLGLDCNRIGDEGAKLIAKALETDRVLERINIGSACISSVGARALAHVLKTNTSLKYLNLGYTKATVPLGERANSIGDKGAAALAAVLQTNTTLRSLDLSTNDITQIGLSKLREALRENKTLVSFAYKQRRQVYNQIAIEEIGQLLRRNRDLVPAELKSTIKDIDLPAHVAEIDSIYRTVM